MTSACIVQLLTYHGTLQLLCREMEFRFEFVLAVQGRKEKKEKEFSVA
jgi:hypothetical protein